MHLSIKALNRSTGRSAVAAAAYRAGERLADERTGEVHDYTRRSGVLYAEVILPDGGSMEREKLWNLVEQAEKRKDAKVAREFVVALPYELSREQQKSLLQEYVQGLCERTGWAVDVAMHAPNRKGDLWNVHAHLLCSTRKIERDPEGCPVMGAKTRDWDVVMTGKDLVSLERETWANTVNQALERSGYESRIDARSYAEQGLEILPTQHLGVHANAMERRGEKTERGDHNREVRAHNAEVIQLKEVRQDREEEQAWQRKLDRLESMPLKEHQEAVEKLYPGAPEQFVERDAGMKAGREWVAECEEKLQSNEEWFKKAEQRASQARSHHDYCRRYHPKQLAVAEHTLVTLENPQLADMLNTYLELEKVWPEKLSESKRLRGDLEKAREDLKNTQKRLIPEYQGAYEEELKRFTEAETRLWKRESQEWEKSEARLLTLPYSQMSSELWNRTRQPDWDAVQREHPGMASLGKKLQETEKSLNKNEEASRNTEREIRFLEKQKKEWREGHKIRAFLHDSGVKKSVEMTSLEQSHARLKQVKGFLGQEREYLEEEREAFREAREEQRVRTKEWTRERYSQRVQEKIQADRLLERKRSLEPKQERQREGRDWGMSR